MTLGSYSRSLSQTRSGQQAGLQVSSVELFLGKDCKPTDLFHPDCSSHANSELGHTKLILCFPDPTGEMCQFQTTPFVTTDHELTNHKWLVCAQ